MKKNLLILILSISLSTFSQNGSKKPEELGLTKREYKKIKKKLGLNIINRDFLLFPEEIIYVGYKDSNGYDGKQWVGKFKDVLFEIGLNQGNLDKADYIFVIGDGGLDLKVLDYYDNNTLIARVTSKKKDYGVFSNKEKIRYKNRIKVLINELLKSEPSS